MRFSLGTLTNLDIRADRKGGQQVMSTTMSNSHTTSDHSFAIDTVTSTIEVASSQPGMSSLQSGSVNHT